MRLLLAALALVAGSALAQQPERKSDKEIEAIFAAVTSQRNQAQDQVASLAAKLQVLEAELAAARKQAEACKPEAKK